jgi:hypothetical protein
MFTIDPNHENFLTTMEFILKLIGGLSGLIIFIIGLRRYIRDQKWKRNEFVAKEIKDFTSDNIVRNAMFILDWGSRYIQLFPDRPNYEERFVKVDRNLLKSALQFHELKIKEEGKDRFTTTEVAIRDTFDHFLSYFERFNQFLAAKLLTKKELEPYIVYWINALSTEIEENSRNVIYHYINSYGFKGTQELFEAFGKNIKPITNIESTVIK